MLGSLRVRTTAGYVLLIVAAFAGLGAYLVNVVGDDVRQAAKADIAAQARMVANLAQPLVEESAAPAAFDELAKQVGAGTNTRVTIIATDGTVLGDSQADPALMENHLGRPDVQEALRSGLGESEGRSSTPDAGLSSVALRVDAGGEPVAVVRAARSADGAAASTIVRPVLVAAAVGAAGAALLSLAIGTTVTRPLGRLTAAARGIASGRLHERISPRPSGELGELGDAFNQMAASLEDLVGAAAQERNRLAAALNSSADAVLAVDAGGQVAFANVAAEQLFERPRGELVGSPFSWAMANEQVSEALRSSRQDGERHRTLIEQPGRRYLQVTTAPIVSGGEWAALVVIHDLSDVKRADQVRRDFVANVSHELRTPLASLKSVIETLEGGALEDAAVARDFLARADGEVDRMVRVVEELLELSRIESGETALAREAVELGTVLGRAVERLLPQAERAGVSLELDVAPELPPLLGDAERLERVAVNLIYNALKFTPAGGSVRVSAALGDGGVTVTVADTGAGIRREDLPRVFERFYKADRARAGAGTGLGLAIVKHTVEAHGGTVSVESEEGRGSTFSISLPVASIPLERQPAG